MSPVVASTPQGVVDAVVALVARHHGRLRLAVDGAAATDPGELADRVVEALAPRTALHVRADRFWRPASLRLEYGREDEESWLDGWLDEDALRREVLDPFVETGRALPELRDPVTDRSLRTDAVVLPPDGVVVVSGSVLLGRGLPFDVAVHLRLTTAALVRRTPDDQAWTIPALERYAVERGPEGAADLVVRVDDPRHPAIVHPDVPTTWGSAAPNMGQRPDARCHRLSLTAGVGPTVGQAHGATSDHGGRPMRTTRVIIAAALAASALLTGAQSASAHEGGAAGSEREGGIRQVRAATAAFRDISVAVAAGWNIDLHDVNGIDCIDNPAGGMGVHFVNGSLVGDGAIDVRTPEAVIYQPGAGGSMKLVAVEYVVIAADWDAHHKHAPRLFGQTFELVPAGNRYGLPDFYELHAWVWKHNPAGMFADWNPNVTCP